MPFFADHSRESLRHLYIEAWRKRRARVPLEPLEAQIADVIEAHPEYHAEIDDPDAIARDYTPEGGVTNPFLHMAFHLAVRDQIATDLPPGVAAAFRKLARREPTSHEAEHAIMECLAEWLWNSQQDGASPSEAEYLERVRRRARRR